MFVKYINQTNQSNKLWEYEIRANGDVVVRHGRIGSHIEEEPPKRNGAWLDKKIAEKLKKGYKLVDAKTVSEETKTARMLGIQYKISRMLFVGRKGNVIHKLAGYDPKQWVFVEIQNSWSKSVTRLLMSKTETHVLNGGYTDMGQSLSFGEVRSPYGDEHDFASTVRDVLRRLAQQVAEVVKTVKFAALGTRKLLDDDDNETDDGKSVMTTIYKSVSTAGVDRSVVVKFAAMGARTLEL